MADPVTDQMRNMNVQEYDGMEFDPLNESDNMESGQHNGGQDLLGGNFGDKAEKIVLFDNQDQFDPMTFLSQGQGHTSESNSLDYRDRKMSEGEILGYQNEYGESNLTGQNEYSGDDDDDDDDDNNLIDIGETDVDNVDQGHLMGQYAGNIAHEENAGEEEEEENGYSPSYDEEHIENDYVDTDEYSGGNFQGQGEVEEVFDGGHVNEALEDDSLHPYVDQERQRRSRSPERSVSPAQAECDHYRETLSLERRRRSLSPERSMSPSRPETGNNASAMSSPSCVESQSALTDMKSETESLDSRSESQGTPKKSKMPKSKLKKPLELPPWNDNVVIPPPPRPKPTLIGKNSELPPSPTPKFRPKTGPARSTPKDASSDSGVEDDKTAKSPRKTSSDVKKRFGVDTDNMSHRPGGGNVQVFSEKVTTMKVAPRTDTSRPKSAMTPRSTPKELSPVTPKPPSPNLKAVQSKINSLKNASHTPGGGNVKVLDAKVDFSNVQSKVGSKEKIHHKPKGGDKKIESRKLNWETESKVGSLKNVTHSPGGGNVKHQEEAEIEVLGDDLDLAAEIDQVMSERLSWSGKSRIGSLDNASHTPGGGNVKILDQKIEIKAQSKVGSTANLKHKPGGGDKKIETIKLDFKDSAKPKVGSLEKVKHKPGGGDVQILSEKLEWKTESRVQSLKNASYVPGGGNVKIHTEKLDWNVEAKVGSLANADHMPAGGNVKILDEKVDFSETAKPKVGSLEKVKHTPGGGDKKIETQKLNFKDTARPRTDTGASSGERLKSLDSTGARNSRSTSVTSSQDGSLQG